MFHFQIDFCTDDSISDFNTCATFFATLGVSVSQNVFTASIFSLILSILNAPALSAVDSISFPTRSFSSANLGQDCPIFPSSSLRIGFVSFHWEASICSALLLEKFCTHSGNFTPVFFAIAHTHLAHSFVRVIGAVTPILIGS